MSEVCCSRSTRKDVPATKRGAADFASVPGIPPPLCARRLRLRSRRRCCSAASNRCRLSGRPCMMLATRRTGAVPVWPSSGRAGWVYSRVTSSPAPAGRQSFSVWWRLYTSCATFIPLLPMFRCEVLHDEADRERTSDALSTLRILVLHGKFSKRARKRAIMALFRGPHICLLLKDFYMSSACMRAHHHVRPSLATSI